MNIIKEKIGKSIVFLFTTLFFTFLSSGCYLFEPFDTSYTGDYPALYTQACKNLETDGFFDGEHWFAEAAVLPVETDDYGRTLFIYCDGNGYYSLSYDNYALMICQYYTEEKVYYYQDDNHILESPRKENGITLSEDSDFSIENPLYGFKDEDIARLKELNDWNKPIDNTKCVYSEIFNDYDKYLTQSAVIAIDEEKLYFSSRNEMKDIVKDFIGIGDEYTISYLGYSDKDSFNNKHYVIEAVTTGSKYIDRTYKQYEIIFSKSMKLLSENSFIYVGEFGSKNRFKDYYHDSHIEYQNLLKKLRADNYWNVCDLDEVIAQQTSSS
ncbi:MAG: hypothetical protein J5762_00390 [Clostridia bacterium]|nr:hypothetical protein [Clostridia bacterium]